MDSHGQETFGAALVELESELDWELLGALYCSEGGSSFFGPEQLIAQRDAALAFAGDLGERLQGAGDGASVYLGAAVFELVPLLCETLALGRKVRALNLDGAEVRELNRGLQVVAERLGAALPRIETGALKGLPEEAFDHGWLVSVLNDPEVFPALHDRLYGRTGALATGHGDLGSEEVAAARLIDELLKRLKPGAWLTTTDEELPLVRAACARRGLSLLVPEKARLSAVVGDPVRHCRLRGADEARADV